MAVADTVLITDPTFQRVSLGSVLVTPTGGTQTTLGAQLGSPTFTNVTLTGLLYESFTDNITAHAGGGQGSATAITTEVSRVTTVATAGDSVALPAATQGLTLYVINHGANAMQVYGSGTDTIDDVATATGVTQMIGSMVVYTCATAGKWYSNGLGTGYSGSFPTASFTDGITAHAGGGRASATAITTVLNRITTVATAADSVVLPASAPGLQITITNAAATNAAQVFAQGSDTIDGTAGSTGISLAAGKTATFFSVAAGVWHKLLSA